MLRGRHRRRCFAGAFAVLLLALPCAGQVPGTRVTLDPPPGFSASAQFPGFQKADDGASIMVTEVPGPIGPIRAGLTTDELAKRGMTLLGSEDITISGQAARLVHFTQAAAGVIYEKWMLLFGTAEQSVIIVGTYPQGTAESLREPIRRSLLSTKWDPTATAGRLDGLPFRIEETSSLKISTRVSNMLLLTKGGVQGPGAAADPLLIVGASFSTVDLSDLERFSTRRLAQIEQVKELSNITGTLARVNDLPAYELTADAQDTRTGVPLRLYQLIAADGTRYFLVQGFVGPADAPQFLPQFREVARSLRRVP